MKGKPIIVGILIAAMLAVCGLSIFAIWQGVRMAGSDGFNFTLGPIDPVEVKETEEKTLSVSGPVELKVENDFGFVAVQPGADGKVVVSTEKVGWGDSETRAQQELADLKVLIEQKGNQIRIYLERPPEVDAINFVPSGAYANFTITVPVETSVDLTTWNGEMNLSGTQGDAALNAGFGSVDVQDLTGALTITASNGRITIENIEAGDAAISLTSEFGDVSMDSVSGGNVTAKSTNGAMTVTNVDASEKLDVRSDFGNIEIRAGEAGSLDVHASNGRILVEDLGVSGNVIISNDFGDLTLVDVLSANMDLRTQNGHINVSGSRGTIKAESDFGEVDISAEQAVVTLISNNGDVSFAGTLVDGEHMLQSDFGDITLTIPADLALNLDLKTDLGKITSDIPLTVSGEIDEHHWTGTINGGGPNLTAATQNGNITIQTAE
ncbi:MAG: DUF4097 family beta strand repeat-containing protein [Chloroflexota bacterium]